MAQSLLPTKLLVLAVALNAILGQLLLKRALVALGGRDALANVCRFFLDALKSPWIYSSLVVQAFGYALWMILISRVKLGVATASVGAGFYVMMPLFAWLTFGESLTLMQWLGILLITAGVSCMSLGSA
jgi:multidrug transporter EmrE-like cation transporter